MAAFVLRWPRVSSCNRDQMGRKDHDIYFIENICQPLVWTLRVQCFCFGQKRTLSQWPAALGGGGNGITPVTCLGAARVV